MQAESSRQGRRVRPPAGATRLPTAPATGPGGSVRPRAGSIAVTGATPGVGLPTSGAIALALGAGLGGGIADILTGEGLRAAFAVAFTLGCVLAAACVRRRGLPAAVIMPPLIYVLVALGASSLQGHTAGSSYPSQAAFQTMTALITGAPVLLLATLAAAGVALGRWFRGHGHPVHDRHLGGG